MVQSEIQMTDRRSFLQALGVTAGSTALGGIGLSAANDGGTTGDRATGDPAAWPRFQYDAANTGRIPGSQGRAQRPFLRQRTDLGAATTVLSDGYAYGTRYEGVVAVDLQTGEEAWRVETGLTVGPPTVLDGTVYVGLVTGPSAVLALSASDGTEQWRVEFGDDEEVRAWPAVADGSVYVKTNDSADDGARTSAFYALSASDGTERWRATNTRDLNYGYDHPGPAVADGTVYFADRGDLVAFEVADGTERWRTYTGQYAEEETSDEGDPYYLDAPTVANGRVYVNVSPSDYALFAFDAADGSLDWRTEDYQYEGGELLYSMQSNRGSVAVDDDTVYVGGETADGTMLALSADDGSFQWEAKGFDGAGGPSTVTDERVYTSVITEAQIYDHGIQALNPDGTRAWFAPTRGQQTSAPPMVVDGTVYTLTDNGFLYAYGDAPEELRWRTDANATVRTDLAAAAGRVYAGTDGGTVYAMDTASGSMLWEYEADGAVRESLVVTDGTVYAADETSVFALDAASGTEQWRTDGDGIHPRTNLTVAAGRVFVGRWDYDAEAARLDALERHSGATTWTFRGRTCGGIAEFRTDPVAGDDRVFVGTGDDLWALDVESGTVQWSQGDRKVASVAFGTGTLYVGESHDIYDETRETVFALNPSDGTERWSADVTYKYDDWQKEDKETRVGALRADGDRVYAVADLYDYEAISTSTLYALDSDDGSVSWSVDPGAERVGGSLTAPATSDDGTLYVGSGDWRAYAIDRSDGAVRERYETTGEVSGTPAVGESGVFVGNDDGYVYSFEREESEDGE